MADNEAGASILRDGHDVGEQARSRREITYMSTLTTALMRTMISPLESLSKNTRATMTNLGRTTSRIPKNSRANLPHTTWNPQSESVLFTLPPEIRCVVFLHALIPYQDTSSLGVSFNSYGYRPETAFPVVQDVALLRTCRQIYLETRELPASSRTFVSWTLVWPARSPHGRAVGPRLNRLATADMPNVRSFHIYAQQCGLERDHWARLATGTGSDPITSIRHLTITIRHTDFYFWESDQALRMDTVRKYNENWRRGFDHFPNLEEFAFEFETLERRKAELDILVQEVKKWRITLQDGRVLSTDGQPLERHTWLGSPQYHGREKTPPGTTELSYYVTKVAWKAPRAITEHA